MNPQFFIWILILTIIEVTQTAPAVSTTATSLEIQPSIDVLSKDAAVKSRQEQYVTHEQINGLPSDSKKLIGGYRQDKMLGYFGYFPQPLAPLPTPFYPQPNFYDDYDQFDEENGIMSRGNRRPVQNRDQGENSPIFYIRLPATPYMFVPGYGYISRPPRITPMNTFGAMNPMAAMQPVQSPPGLGLNPFINLPVNFLSNGKPTNIYQWGSNPMYTPNPYSQFGYPAQPTYKPKPQYLPTDSKIHHLKGQYLFNGRPEDIYVLPNSYNSLFPEPMQNYY